MSDRLKWNPKLRRDAVYLKSEEGIIFRSPSADFQLKGGTIYDSFTALLPHLDGSTSEDALLEALRPAQRDKTRSLLDLLATRDVIRRVDPEDLGTLEPALRNRFASQIDFIGHFADDPGQRFARFRNARIALVGSGDAFVSAGLALLDNGLAHLVLASSDRQALNDPAWDAQCFRLAESGVAATVERTTRDRLDSGDFDLVLCCGELGDAPMLAALNALVLGDGCAVLPAFTLDRHSYVGPLTEPGRAGCWMCAMMRWSDHAPAASAADFWRDMALPGAQPRRQPALAGTTAQMLGNGVAMEAFRFFIGLPAIEARNQLLDQDLDSLETARRRFLRHPDCPRCSALPVDAADIEAVADEQELLARWTPLLGHPFATFGMFDDGGIEHLPVSISLVATGDTQVAGWSLDSVLHARVAALGEAVRHVVARDGGHLAESAQAEESVERVAPSRIAGWLGVEDEAATLVGGEYVRSGARVLVPAAALHSAHDKAGCFDPGRCGLGVAMSRDRAVNRAVRDLLEREMLDLLADGRLPLARFDRQVADAAIDYLLTAIGLMKAESPRIALARHGSGLVGALLLPDGDSLAANAIRIASGTRATEAVRRLLLRHLATLQLTRQGLTVPRRSAGGIFADIPIDLPALSTLPPWHDDAVGMDDMHAHLAASGSAIVAVDVTPVDIQETRSLTAIRTLLVANS